MTGVGGWLEHRLSCISNEMEPSSPTVVSRMGTFLGHFPPSMQPGPLSMIAFARLTCGAHNFMLIPVCMVAPSSSDFCGGKKREAFDKTYVHTTKMLNSDIHGHRLQ